MLVKKKLFKQINLVVFRTAQMLGFILNGLHGKIRFSIKEVVSLEMALHFTVVKIQSRSSRSFIYLLIESGFKLIM